MSARKCLILAASILVAGGARAADYPPAFPPMERGPAPVVEEFTSGWYLRGDVGYRANSMGDAVPAFDAIPINNSLEDSTIFGGGGGYKSGWFRADVTVDYASKADYSSNLYRAQIGAFTVLGNVYLDLGTWGAITPYIGAGAGGAYLSVHEFNYPSNSLLVPTNSRWHFAWAAMAGVAWRVAHRWSVDAGYRYIDMGDAISPWVNAMPQLQQVTIKDITAHEFRLGVRYALD